MGPTAIVSSVTQARDLAKRERLAAQAEGLAALEEHGVALLAMIESGEAISLDQRIDAAAVDLARKLRAERELDAPPVPRLHSETIYVVERYDGGDARVGVLYGRHLRRIDADETEERAAELVAEALLSHALGDGSARVPVSRDLVQVFARDVLPRRLVGRVGRFRRAELLAWVREVQPC